MWKRTGKPGHPLVALLVSSVTALAAHADCKPQDPVGHFEGQATSLQAGKVDLSLNLRCENGEYTGELATSVGMFPIKNGHFEADRLVLHFDRGSDIGTIEGNYTEPSFRGHFVLGQDTGPVSLDRTGEALTPASTKPTLELPAEKWRADLEFFAAELPSRHANAFHHITRERYDSEIRTLDRKIDHLNGDQIYVGLNRIANLIGDGHTFVVIPPDRANLAVDVRRFGGEYRITAVTPENRKALGLRLLRINDVPIERVRKSLEGLTPADETSILADVRIEGFLTTGMLLHGLGIIPDRNVARYTLAGDGAKEFTVDIPALPPDAAEITWVYAFNKRPLYMEMPDEGFWYTYLKDSRAVYCNFRSYDRLADKAPGLFRMLADVHPDKLVIDLRHNGGGDFQDGLKYVIDPIRELPALNQKGHLFVLIGPHTFSAAMSNAAQFRSRTQAMLVGQTIGEKPNSYQEPREMTLPNSHLIVRYSTKYYEFVEEVSNLVRPGKEIIPTWSDYREGRDPVLDWVLSYPLPTP